MINQTNRIGRTSLHCATQLGHIPVIDALLSYGADINCLTSDGQSCLHLAFELCNKPDSKVEMTPSVSKVHVSHRFLLSRKK